MAQPKTDKQDQLRAMREARFKSAKAPTPADLARLRETVAKIPVKRRPKVKR